MTATSPWSYRSAAFRSVRRFWPALAVVTFAIFNLSAAGPVSSAQVLKTTTTWNGAPIRYSASAHPEVQGVVVEIAPGSATPWHKHPVNNFAYMLAGQLRVELAGQSVSHEFKTGDAFAEVVDTWHRGVNIGSVPVKILVFYAGEEEVPISITQPVSAAASTGVAPAAASGSPMPKTH